MDDINIMIKVLLTFMVLFAVLAMLVLLEYYRLSHQSKLQNIKAINLYLHKQLINKLITTILDARHKDLMEYISDEVMSYFCLDSISLMQNNRDDYYTYTNRGSRKYLKRSDLIEIFKELKNDEEIVIIKNINHEVGNLYGCKHYSLAMVVVTEEGHTLNNEEANVLGHDIMAIFRIAILLSEKSLYTIAQTNL